MLDTLWIKAFIVLLFMIFLAIWIKWFRLSRIRKSSPKMLAPSKSMALATATLDRGLILILLGFVCLFLLWGNPHMFLSFSCPFDFPIQLIGMVVLVAAASEAWWGVISLGEYNVSRWARLKEGHQVVKTGAYCYVRHPLYLSRMIFYLGAFLLFQNLLFLPILMVCFPLAYLQAKSEERLLIKVFGAEYESYQAASGMFLPPLFRWIRHPRMVALQGGTEDDDNLS